MTLRSKPVVLGNQPAFQVGNRLLSIWAGDRTEYTLGVTIRTAEKIEPGLFLSRITPESQQVGYPAAAALYMLQSRTKFQ